MPQRPYFTLSGLAKSWDCTEEDILHDGIYRQLKICVISAGWELQEGYYFDEGPHIPIKERRSNKEILQLKEHALREILSCGKAVDPEFVLEADEAMDQGAESDEYECFLSSVVITQNMESPRGNVIVRKNDLIIKIEDAEAFLSIYTKKDREVLQNALSPENETAWPIASALKPQKQKRRHELHDLIGRVIVELGFKGSQAPANDVWNHLRKEKEKYDCIQEVDDKKIWWTSLRGYERKMERISFNNIVSQYNNGKRPYP